MQYFGGKSRIANEIVPIINLLRNGRPYFEPFVGGANVLTGVFGGERYASDVVPELIELYKALQTGWAPPHELDERTYNYLKLDPTPSALKAFAAFGCSFAGKYFGGYAGRGSRNYASNAANSLETKRAGLTGVSFFCGDYRTFQPSGCLIYCDPPYKGTTPYVGAGKFDSDEFWGVCKEWSKTNTVLVSEYEAPDDAALCWEKEVKTDIRGGSGKLKRVERLYIV